MAARELWSGLVFRDVVALHTLMAGSRTRRRTAVALACALAGCSAPERHASPPPGPTASAPAGPRLYVTNERSGDLSVVDVTSRRRIATLRLGKRPRGARLAPDRSVLYVALSGSPFAPPGVDEKTLPPPDRSADGIGVVDLQALRLVRVIPVGTDPEQLAVSPDGRRLFVANEDAATVSVVDVASGRVLAALPVGGEPEGVEATPDGAVVYATSEEDSEVFAIDAQGMKLLGRFAVPVRPRGIAFLPDGSRAYVTCETGHAVAVVDARARAVVGTIPFEGENARPMGIVASRDGRRVYVTTGRGGAVVAIDTGSGRPAAQVEVGARPWGIALSADGRTLYTANGPSNDVSIVDVARFAVTGRVGVGDGPWGVAVAEPAP